jgi:hypothetical protein
MAKTIQNMADCGDAAKIIKDLFPHYLPTAISGKFSAGY